MPSDVRTGSVLAGFRIESQIGEGAMGAVFQAEDTRRGGYVALKVLVRDVAEDDRFRRRFLRESKLAASLDHPNIVPIRDAGEEDGVLYLAMELVEGIDLRALLRREHRLDSERAIGLVAQIGDALDAAHAAGLVHRDVKPANILLSEPPDGEHAYVCDFGLARHLSSASSLTTDHGLVGTIDYIPPEQIEGGEIDGRADVYSLACVLFECLAGSRPFDRESELSVVFAHLNEPPPRLSEYRPELPATFDDVFATSLAKSPDARYSTCAQLVEAACAAMRGDAPPRPRPNRRRLAAAVVGLLIVALVIASAVVSTTRGGSASDAPTITQTSIAGARLGLRRSEYEAILGRSVPVTQPPDVQGHPSLEYPTLVFERPKVWVFFPDGFDATGEIIVTWNEEFTTDDGIGPCSTIEDLKAAHGDKVRPDYFGTIETKETTKHFMYDLGRNLLFATSGELSPPGKEPIPGKYVAAVGLFDGNAPGADQPFGARPNAGYVTGNQTPACVP